MQKAFTGGYKLWVGQPGEQKQQGNTIIDTQHFVRLCEQVLTSVLISSKCDFSVAANFAFIPSWRLAVCFFLSFMRLFEPEHA